MYIPKHCLLRGCNSLGHVDGISDSHITLSGCPQFHNSSAKYFRDLRDRDKSDDPMHKLEDQKLPDGKQPINLREPDFSDVASPTDIEIFRRAQQKLVSDKVVCLLVKIWFRYRK